MRESAYINKVIQQGREEGRLLTRRENLLQLIQVCLQDPVPEPIRRAIESTNDLELLSKWFSTPSPRPPWQTCSPS